MVTYSAGKMTLLASALSAFAVLASSAAGQRAGTDQQERSSDDASMPDITRCDQWIHSRHSGDKPAVTRFGLATLCLDTVDGEMTAEVAKQFIAALAGIAGTHKPDLVVRSLGGNVEYGLAMGEALAARKGAVSVSMFCGSSCANYLFLPASKRHVLRNSVVFFHGGINRATLESWVEAQAPAGADPAAQGKVRRRIEANLHRQASLLRKAGVDPGLFEWMEAINHDRALVTRHCPGMDKVRVLVFSDAFLASKGAPTASNEGPRTRADLYKTLQPFGLAETTCFWS